MSRRTYENIHGRRWGRGIRTYLLLPKIVFVAAFLGGLVSVLVLAYGPGVPATPEAWAQHAALVSRAYTLVIVPALLGAIVMGVLLLSTHFGALIRMRWAQVKLVLIGTCVPALHVYMRGRSLALQAALEGAGNLAEAEAIRRQMLNGTLVTLVFALVVICLGRIKPRLWQSYGRTFPPRQKRREHPEPAVQNATPRR